MPREENINRIPHQFIVYSPVYSPLAAAPGWSELSPGEQEQRLLDAVKAYNVDRNTPLMTRGVEEMTPNLMRRIIDMFEMHASDEKKSGEQ